MKWLKRKALRMYWRIKFNMMSVEDRKLSTAMGIDPDSLIIKGDL